MHSLRRRGLASVLAVGITAVLLAAPTAKAAAPTPEGEAYRVIDLGTLNGSDSSEAFAVNERGHAAGQSDGHATLWRNGRVIDLGVLPGGLWSVATDLNDRRGVLSPEEGAIPIVRAALLGDDGPTGTFSGADGPLPW